MPRSVQLDDISDDSNNNSSGGGHRRRLSIQAVPIKSRLIQLYKDVQKLTVNMATKGWDFYFGLSVFKRLLVVAGMCILLVAGVVVVIFHKRLIEAFISFSQAWKELKYGPLIMFGLITLVSFPPLIGYSTLGMLCGMMYGFPGGVFILIFATLFGSTVSFLVFRYFFFDYAERLAQSNRKFAILSKAMEHDSFKLLWMIRLCPLPYSLSNGALASIPTVKSQTFFLATLSASPKLLIPIFIGDRIMRLGQEKDTVSRIVDVLSILIAVIFSTVTAYTIYVRTLELAEHGDMNSYRNISLEDGGEEEEDDDDLEDALIDDDLLNSS